MSCEGQAPRYSNEVFLDFTHKTQFSPILVDSVALEPYFRLQNTTKYQQPLSVSRAQSQGKKWQLGYCFQFLELGLDSCSLTKKNTLKFVFPPSRWRQDFICDTVGICHILLLAQMWWNLKMHMDQEQLSHEVNGT